VQVPGAGYLLTFWREHSEQIPESPLLAAGLDALVAALVLRAQLLQARLASAPALRGMSLEILRRPVSAL